MVSFALPGHEEALGDVPNYNLDLAQLDSVLAHDNIDPSVIQAINSYLISQGDTHGLGDTHDKISVEVGYSPNDPAEVAILPPGDHTVNTNADHALQAIVVEDGKPNHDSHLTVTGDRNVFIGTGDGTNTIHLDDWATTLPKRERPQHRYWRARSDSIYAGGNGDSSVAGSGSHTSIDAPFGSHETLVGGSGAYDTLISGSGSHNLLRAGHGDHQFLDVGNGGHNSLIGGDGRDDWLLAGNGNEDSLLAGSVERQVLQAGSGNADTLIGGRGYDDFLQAGNGSHYSLRAGDAPPRLQVGNGAGDTLIGGGGYADWLQGGNGHRDSLRAGSGDHQSLQAGSGNAEHAGWRPRL